MVFNAGWHLHRRERSFSVSRECLSSQMSLKPQATIAGLKGRIQKKNVVKYILLTWNAMPWVVLSHALSSSPEASIIIIRSKRDSVSFQLFLIFIPSTESSASETTQKVFVSWMNIQSQEEKMWNHLRIWLKQWEKLYTHENKKEPQQQKLLERWS